jgi:type VI secretion system protein VasG
MTLDLRSLIGKLDDTCRKALNAASGTAVSRTHYDVDVEHWIAALLDEGDSDIPRVLRHFDVNPEQVARDFGRALDLMKTGNGSRPSLATAIEGIARDAWVLASVNHDLVKIRSGSLLLAGLQDDRLARRLTSVSPSLQAVSPEALDKDFLQLVEGSKEDREVAVAAAAVRPGAAGEAGSAASGSETPSLDQFTIDLTSQARQGKIDPVLGRDGEIRQVVDILLRKRQNNPILTGEAGVGKTAVAEGFAQRIADGDVPEPLQNVSVRTLDLGLLQAGAGVKGEFENRLKGVIEEVQSSPRPIILFIDEAHTMIGAGGAEGQSDAANLLKPALARGQLRTIAATTWAEYKKYFEKDAALSRRFQVVKVEEPEEEAAIGMMRGVARHLESHHRVRILDEGVVESVRLSSRYIPGRQLPDKSMSVLDTACARVAMAQYATPGEIEDLRRRIEAYDTEERILKREAASSDGHGERLEEIGNLREGLKQDLVKLEERWQKELALIKEMGTIRDQLDLATGAVEPEEGQEVPEASAAEGLRAELDTKRAELTLLQGEDPLVTLDVDGQAIAEVISSWTGIPVGKMVADEIQTVLDLEHALAERVIGQDHALQTIARRIHTARANLDNPNRPIGVFLLIGTSGVGKTETACALADALYGGERNMVTINMSEYQESHTVSGLRGSPPGYVGYGEGGVLTEAVRRRPYSIVLLDEVEKAHPDVMELFFQVFDKGTLEDGEGREIDFRNTIILLGSNVASDTIMKLCDDPDTRPTPDGLIEATRPQVLDTFPAALIGRLVPVVYYPISPDVLRRIIQLQLDRIVKRVRENHKAELSYGEEIIEAVASRCDDPESGARNVDRILTNNLLPQMAAEVLTRMADGTEFARIDVGLDADGGFSFKIS